MKLRHYAPHMDFRGYFKDVEDRKLIASYRATYKRKIRALKKVKLCK